VDSTRLVAAGAPAATSCVLSAVRKEAEVDALVMPLVTADAAAEDAVVTVKATTTPVCSRWRPAPPAAVTLVMAIALVATLSCVASVATNAVCAAVLNCATVRPFSVIAADTIMGVAAGIGVVVDGGVVDGGAAHVGMGMGPM
jgi:hypothetical protein